MQTLLDSVELNLERSDVRMRETFEPCPTANIITKTILKYSARADLSRCCCRLI